MDIKTILVMTAIFVVISVIYFATQKKVIHQPSVATPQKPDPLNRQWRKLQPLKK